MTSSLRKETSKECLSFNRKNTEEKYEVYVKWLEQDPQYTNTSLQFFLFSIFVLV